MGKRLTIELGTKQVAVSLNDTAVAQALAAAAPFEAVSNRWGDEVYFATPVEADGQEAAAETVAPGAVGYWPPGRALCLFFGPTPLSEAGTIRPASPVAVIGQLGDHAAEVLAEVDDGQPVRVSLAAATDS